MYNLSCHHNQIRGGRTSKEPYVPPEFLYAIKANDAFDILHPALGRDPTRGLRHGCLGEGRHGCLRQVASLGRGRVEPERPRREQRVLGKPMSKAKRERNA